MDEGFEVPDLGKTLDFRLGLQKSNHCLLFVSQLSLCLGRAEEELGKAELQLSQSGTQSCPLPRVSLSLSPAAVTRARHHARHSSAAAP